jgi:hypothetical protein
MTPALLLLLLGQTAEPPKLDPTLPDDLRPMAKMVVEAELDPKRGTGNAVEILKAEQTKHRDQYHQMAVSLRMAAVVLRKRFISAEEFPVPIRYEQALSTFARLDLSDPGVKEWIDLALKHHDYARKKIGKKSQRRIKASIQTRGGLDKNKVAKPIAELIRSAGFELTIVPLKEATMIITASAEDAPPEKNLRMVRVQLNLESIRNSETVWRHALYRTEGGVDADEAIGRSLSWLAKVGGRDLFFRWLGEEAFHSFLQGGPTGKKDPHEGHAGEGPRSFSPQGQKK